MQPRATRFWLRFDSGPRQGETVPLAEGTLSVGRRSANQVVLADGSVSGFHAELHVGPRGVEAVDLESTNGTRVGPERITRAPLAHGDTVAFGSIEATLVDQEFAAGAATGDAGGAPAADGALERVGSAQLAAAGKRGVLAPVLLVVALVGGGAALYFLRGGSEGGTSGPAPVEEVPGNLLADGSFEDDASARWETAAAATEAFAVVTDAARSGALGLGALLDPPPADDEGRVALPWSYATSPPHAVGSGRGLSLRAHLQAGDSTKGRIGLAFSSERGEGPPFVAWSRAVSAGEAFSERVLTAAVPPGYDHVHVAVAARGEGWLSLDDVVLLVVDAPAPLAEAEGFAAHGYGPDATTLTLVRSGTTLFPVLDFGAWGPSGLRGGATGAWSASAEAGRLVLIPSGADADAGLEARVAAFADGDDAGGGWLSSLGADGYRSHAASFEVDTATDLLLGRGFDLLRVGLEPAQAVTGRLRESVLSLTFAAVPARLELQGSFGEERAAARQLRSDAREAEREGRPGAALARWQRLLDELPFEADLVSAAESARTRLIQDGLARVEEVAREAERARFFGLTDLYTLALNGAEEIASSYSGTEVAEEARALADTVRSELAELSSSTEDDGVLRTRAVLQALEGTAAEAVRDHVRQALAELERDAERQDTAAPGSRDQGE